MGRNTGNYRPSSGGYWRYSIRTGKICNCFSNGCAGSENSEKTNEFMKNKEIGSPKTCGAQSD